MPRSSSIFAICCLSRSVKSTPLVCAPSRSSRQRLPHGGVGQPLAVDRHGVALQADITAFEEKSLRVVAGVDREALGAASAGKLFQRIAQHRRHALTGCTGMNVEHVEMI